MLRTIRHILAFTLCVLVTACGTDTGSGDHGTEGFGGQPTPGVTVSTSSGSPSTGSGFSLRVTDAPIDGLARVVMQFIAVEMKQEGNGWIRYTLPKPQPIDLLSLHGLTTADLLVHMPIEPGDYKQVRFLVDETPMANWVELKTGGVQNLEVPKGSTTGLKVKQYFTIPENKLVNFTVDFDLRKSVKYKKGPGVYRFKAKMRLVVDTNVSVIRGSVDPLLLVDPSCSDLDVDSHNAVYVYSGHNAATDDIDLSSTTNNEPLTTTPIVYDAKSGAYIYEAAFLPQDDYTVAFNCNADLDDIEADDVLPFFHVQNTSVLVTDTTFLKP